MKIAENEYTLKIIKNVHYYKKQNLNLKFQIFKFIGDRNTFF